MFSHKVLIVAITAVSGAAFAQAQPQPAPAIPAVAQPAAPAAQAVPSRPSREAAQIAEINERIAVMSAQLAELEMQSKISAKRTEIEKAEAASRGLAINDDFIPSVREISGVDGRVWAVLNVPGGNTQTVRVGDRVGAWQVTQILRDSVSVKRGKETIRLSFGFNAPQPETSPSTQLPPPPYPGR